MMKEDKLTWCLKQKRGITLVEENPSISKDYMRKADDTLEKVMILDGDWLIITAYYACYNAFYSVLQRAGIKSEIHSCTIELLDLFEEIKDYKVFLENLKDNRINVQYYLKEPEKIDKKQIAEFINECKLTLDQLNSFKIEKIRDKLKDR